MCCHVFGGGVQHRPGLCLGRRAGFPTIDTSCPAAGRTPCRNIFCGVGAVPDMYVGRRIGRPRLRGLVGVVVLLIVVMSVVFSIDLSPDLVHVESLSLTDEICERVLG